MKVGLTNRNNKAKDNKKTKKLMKMKTNRTTSKTKTNNKNVACIMPDNRVLAPELIFKTVLGVVPAPGIPPINAETIFPKP